MGGRSPTSPTGATACWRPAWALKLADVVVTEAGFATDLGAEKFFDIKCRLGGLKPAAAVIVATARALKMHGGVPKTELDQERMPELTRGFDNLAKHIENIRMFGVPLVVAVNRFATDTPRELAWIVQAVEGEGCRAVVSDVFANGPVGGEELAQAVAHLLQDGRPEFNPLYPLEMPLEEKLNVIARCCYGASEVTLLKPARESLAMFERLGYRKLPVCIAKTQSSLSDVNGLLGRPRGFKVTIREARLSAGAGFVVAIAGEIMTMPGLPKTPAAHQMDVDATGRILNLS
jgi:formate--tetrahydrofolate ligase